MGLEGAGEVGVTVGAGSDGLGLIVSVGAAMGAVGGVGGAGSAMAGVGDVAVVPVSGFAAWVL